MRLYWIELAVYTAFVVPALFLTFAFDEYSYTRAGWMLLLSVALMLAQFSFGLLKAMKMRMVQSVLHLGLVLVFLVAAGAFIVEKCPYGSGCSGSGEILAAVSFGTACYFAAIAFAILLPAIALTRQDDLTYS